MWVDQPTDVTFGPITASAAEGTVSVSATANVSSIVWNMGDGTKVNCTGKGTPYADHYGKQASPTCGHRYAKRSEEHTSELQSLMRISYAVFCLQKKTKQQTTKHRHIQQHISDNRKN